MISKYYNDGTLKNRLYECEKRLDDICSADYSRVAIEIDTDLEKVKRFYAHTFEKIAFESSARELIDQYELFITCAEAVKLGKLRADKAIAINSKSTYTRKINIAVHNFFKSLECLFWSLVVSFSLIAFLKLGCPLVLLEPCNGIIVALATSAAFFYSLDALDKSIDEFKTYNDVEQEGKNENNCFHFFDNQFRQSTPTIQEDGVPLPLSMGFPQA